MTNSEKALFDKIDLIILENSGNQLFSPDNLCQALGLSRSQVFRLIKDHTSLSPSIYIRKIKLAKAKNLLETSELNIAEITYQVGIDSPQSFSKYFSQEFGLSPSDFRKNSTQNQSSIANKSDSVIIKNKKLFGLLSNKKARFFAVLFTFIISLLGFYVWKTSKQNAVPKVNASFDVSIAILPFRSLQKAENELFENGLIYQVHSFLSKFSQFKVISNSSSMLFRDSKKTIPQIAKALQVKYILVGNIAKQQGKQINLRFELIDAQEDRTIWTKEMTGKDHEIIFSINEVAKEVAKMLDSALKNADFNKLDVLPSKNLQAYNNYLEGLTLIEARSKEKLTASLVKFDAAIALDADFSLAYSQKAQAYFYLGNLQHISADSSAKLTEKNALYALRLDDGNGLAYAMLANIYRVQGKWEQANITYQIALKNYPNDAMIHYWYSMMLRQVGLLDDAVKHSTKAMALDPLASIILAGHLLNCTFAHQDDLYDETVKKGDLLFDDSFLFYISKAYHFIQKNDFDNALKTLDKAYMLSHQHKVVEALICFVKGRTGKIEEVQKVLNTTQKTPQNYHFLVFAYAGLQDKGQCLFYLEALAAMQDMPADFNISPIFTFLHSDSRYQALIKKLGLLDTQIQIEP